MDGAAMPVTDVDRIMSTSDGVEPGGVECARDGRLAEIHRDADEHVVGRAEVLEVRVGVEWQGQVAPPHSGGAVDPLDHVVVRAIGRHDRREGRRDLVLGVRERPEHAVDSGNGRHFPMVGAAEGKGKSCGALTPSARSAAGIAIEACVRLAPHRLRRPSVSDLSTRPWLAQYAPGVPSDIEPTDETLCDLLDDAVARFAEHGRPRLLRPDDDLRRARRPGRERAAGALRDLGVRQGDRVALVLPNCPQHVVAFYAVLRLGAIVVEHNPLYTTEELATSSPTTGPGSRSRGTRPCRR